MLVRRAALLPLTDSSFSPCQLKSEIETSGCKSIVWLKPNFPPVNSFLFMSIPTRGIAKPHDCLWHLTFHPSPHPFYGLKVLFFFFLTIFFFFCWRSSKPLEGQTSEISFHFIDIQTPFLHPTVKNWFQMNILIRSYYIKHVKSLTFSISLAKEICWWLCRRFPQRCCVQILTGIYRVITVGSVNVGQDNWLQQRTQSVSLCPWESSL